MILSSAPTAEIPQTRHILHEQIDAKQAGHELDDAHQHGRGEKVLDPVIADEWNDQYRNGGGRGGNHAGTAADQRHDDGDRERRVKPDTGVQAGKDGKTDGLGDEGKGDDDTCKNVRARIGHPLATKR